MGVISATNQRLSTHPSFFIHDKGQRDVNQQDVSWLWGAQEKPDLGRWTGPCEFLLRGNILCPGPLEQRPPLTGGRKEDTLTVEMKLVLL